MMEILISGYQFVLISLALCLFFVDEITSFFVMCCYSLFNVLMFLLLNAQDVAMTEASLGSVISTIFLMNIIKISDKTHNVTSSKKLNKDSDTVALAKSADSILGFVIAVLIFFDKYFGFTDKLNLTNFHDSHLNIYYLNNTYRDIGIDSSVAAILADYRGFDTLIETTVIFAGAVSLWLINSSRR